ncbi:dihydroneopterin triphosphate 2'-epimerase [Methylonatrum kenyense]|uniref:dihydroneopterin triphosphate 2'-epimerase n=1 Tax=Methylonatrum kenyense TaxID=455253 RepID=UPI0020C12507|nr:dihydroneopterin triphosphate 2'-epimerase [Methylonatrum kenyense]MCK8516206.1 dihydroneopterin triphosphate 2'-epimerase [Methylonatrum kenyense]
MASPTPESGIRKTEGRTLERSRIRIKELRLRTFIGFNPEEQQKLQDVVINVLIEYDALKAARSDQPEEALNYKTVTKQIIRLVEENRFLLLEKLVHDVLNCAMEHPSVERAEVEIDKPHALRFADSVSLTMSAHRNDTGG